MPFPYAALARYAAAVLLASTAAVAGAAQAPQAPPPIASFFGDPQFARPALSPDGKLLAVVSATPGKRDALTVIDLSNKKNPYRGRVQQCRRRPVPVGQQ